MLRFAILKTVNATDVAVVLEYDADQIKSRLVSRIIENIVDTESTKRKHSKDVIKASLVRAWDGLVTEFKANSVRIK